MTTTLLDCPALSGGALRDLLPVFGEPAPDEDRWIEIGDQLTRREFIGAGAAGALTLGLATSLPDTSEAAAPTRRVRGAYGDVLLPAQPRRVVAVDNPSLATCLDVGVTPLGTLSPPGDTVAPRDAGVLRHIRSIGEQDVKLEQVVALKPDLVIGTAAYLKQSVWSALNEAVPTYVLPGNLPWQGAAAAFANALGREPRLTNVKAAYNAQYAKLHHQFRSVLANSNWESIYSWSSGWGREAPIGDGPSGADDLGMLRGLGATVGSAGIRPGSAGNAWKSYSFEELGVLADADVMLVLGRSGERGVEHTSLWQTLPAVKAGRVYTSPYLIANSYSIATAFLQQIESICKTLQKEGK